MHLTWAKILFLPIFSFIFITSVNANGYTLIINQIRGVECCDKGNLDNFARQIQLAESLNLPTNFAIRYDALLDPTYQKMFTYTPKEGIINFGGFLEITPNLASASGVLYTGDEDNWYQANHAYLIGYQPNDRLKIIDTYMSAFYQVFHHYPNFTTAWMIDPQSLAYLKEKYGVQIHQITREQFGTDSYTLYGGPPHYPYFPSKNWALIPDSNQDSSLPLIVRQTITDPVFNYGDQSNAYTSQPNDYALRQADLTYFKFLFEQAHQQTEQNYTFALIGLENSMPEETQAEFERQLQIVQEWQKTEENLVMKTNDFYNEFQQKKLKQISPSVYAGHAEENPQEQAWWITGDTYRARLRLSADELFLSDLRLYQSDFPDPYLEQPAQTTGRWLVPFLFSNSISYGGDVNDPLVYNDDLTLQPQLARLTLTAQLNQLRLERHQETQVLTFFNDQIPLATFSAQTATLGGKPLESFGELHFFDNTFSPSHSTLTISNRFAIAARNPIRLIFYPRNQARENIYLDQLPVVITDLPLDSIVISQPNPRNGMIFIDLNNAQPAKVNVQLELAGYTKNATVYFAPACGDNLKYCLKHPLQSWWYFRNWVGDKIRDWRNR